MESFPSMIHRFLLLGSLCAVMTSFGCDDGVATGTGGTSSGGTSSGGSSSDGSGGTTGSTDSTSLRGAYSDFFEIGAAVALVELEKHSEILTTHMNHLTAENAMKAAVLHPTETGYAWTEADAIADYARANGMKMTGHTLLWHRQQPDWFFAGLTPGDAASIETLKTRLKSHIEAVVARYADVVDNWDVVNEVISDDTSKTYRDAADGSPWFEYFGSEEFIYFAFLYTRDALEALEAGSSTGKLYYNDYNVNLKIDGILEMAAWLEERGIHIDGIGDQAHYRMEWPPIAELRTTYDRIIEAGYLIKVSELDVSLYNDYPSGTFEPAPEVEFTAELETAQAARYRALFELYREKADHITSVTFWGLTDDRTWLDHEPVENRNDHPLLWDDLGQPKEALGALLDF